MQGVPAALATNLSALKTVTVQTLAVKDLGVMDYQQAWAAQRERHAAVAAGEAPPTLFFVEHPPVFTFGRRGGEDHLLSSKAALEAQGFSFYDIERGGDVTYHGPGQLVGYPILPVARSARSYLRQLEAVMVEVLASYGLKAQGSPGYAGVWVGEDKLVAIGVAIKKNVSFHGFAFNVNTNLAHFAHIIPCGIRDKGVSSLAALLGEPASMEDVKARVTQAFINIFSVQELP